MSDALLTRLFRAIDAMDIEAFVDCLTEDGLFRFASAPPVRGRTAVGQAVGEFFATIAGLSHELTRTVSDGDTLICEGEVTYTRHDGSRITLPFADIFELKDGLIADYRIYADVGPLYAN